MKYGQTLESFNAEKSVDFFPLQVDALHSVQDDSDTVKVAEDVGREDTFVDCSEEIENSEAHQSEESKDIVQDTQSEELNNENNVQELTAEVQNLRNKLERIVAEKCNVEQDYEVYSYI